MSRLSVAWRKPTISMLFLLLSATALSACVMRASVRAGCHWLVTQIFIGHTKYAKSGTFVSSVTCFRDHVTTCWGCCSDDFRVVLSASVILTRWLLPIRLLA